MYTYVNSQFLFASALREGDKRNWWHGQGEAFHRRSLAFATFITLRQARS